METNLPSITVQRYYGNDEDWYLLTCLYDGGNPNSAIYAWDVKNSLGSVTRTVNLIENMVQNELARLFLSPYVIDLIQRHDEKVLSRLLPLTGGPVTSLYAQAIAACRRALSDLVPTFVDQLPLPVKIRDDLKEHLIIELPF